MCKTVEIRGITYNVNQTADKVTLQRYNEKYKMWINLHFPKGNEDGGKRIEEDIIKVLSSQYIQKNAHTNSSLYLSEADSQVNDFKYME